MGSTDNRIAVVIPAYKIDYIEQTFESIARQTDKHFNLYVIDDASPYDIKTLFDKYFLATSNAIYYRFEENLGGKDLVAHWNRCLTFLNKEEWVWFFSDDDIMCEQCIEKFYDSINVMEKDQHYVLRFNWIEIDIHNKPTKNIVTYRQNLSVEHFFSELYLRRIDARMQEFVFSREKLTLNQGFVPFDLAWRSDNATVISVGYPKTIHTIQGALVYWRKSASNISGRTDIQMNIRKNIATINFFNWVDVFFKKQNIEYDIPITDLIHIYAVHILPIDKGISWMRILQYSFLYDGINSLYKWLLYIYNFHLIKKNRHI